jgi:hypothetical protein
MHEGTAPIWTPPKAYDRAAAAASQAAKEYDARLGFGRNEETGQWVVFIRQGESEETRAGDLPILGFQTIPSPDEVKKRLYESDAVRRGSEILDAINRHNDEIQQRFKDAADDAIGETAEAMEWFNRQAGTHPVPRVFITKEVTDGS